MHRSGLLSGFFVCVCDGHRLWTDSSPSARYFTQKKARLLNVTGWVRNLPNNKVRLGRLSVGTPPCFCSFVDSFFFSCTILTTRQVEGEVQGEEADVADLLQKLDRGPTSARVVRFDKENREVVEGEDSFEIKR